MIRQSRDREGGVCVCLWRPFVKHEHTPCLVGKDERVRERERQWAIIRLGLTPQK